MSLEWFGDEISDKLKSAGGDALYEASAAYLTRANKTCPHDEGTLERSGHNTVDRNKLLAKVGYNTPYAVKVHEAPPSWDFRGKGRRKWLEKTGREMKSELEDKIAEVIEENME